MDAGMPMPALVTSMPIPSNGLCSHIVTAVVLLLLFSILLRFYCTLFVPHVMTTSAVCLLVLWKAPSVARAEAVA
jgi:hypothetical protein